MRDIQMYLPLIAVLYPALAGAAVISIKYKNKDNSLPEPLVIVLAIIGSIVSMIAIVFGKEYQGFSFTTNISLSLRNDIFSRGFAFLTQFVMLFTSIYTSEYMKEHNPQKEDYNGFKKPTFRGWLMVVWGMLNGVAFSGNILTFYMFYELMSLASMVMVIFEMTKEAIFAAKKYIYYSIGGAGLAMVGFAILDQKTHVALNFVPGGNLANINTDDTHVLLIAAFCVIAGFAVKCGLFPMHGWLPTAHPVAPAPGSAVLSALITKCGAMGVVRAVFYLFGVDFIRGTWVQYSFIILALITIFMGSMLAYKENLLKKRLAYSTVSQVSYVLFGIMVLNPLGLIGAMLHALFHGIIKTGLFLNAGSIIHIKKETAANKLRGIGKEMPITLSCFTVGALGLIGIPPVCGFVSKWYLALGALDMSEKIIGYVGVAILLVSALLTAGYLLSIVIAGFFPGEDYVDEGNIEHLHKGYMKMHIANAVFAIAALLMGVFANVIYNLIFEQIYALF